MSDIYTFLAVYILLNNFNEVLENSQPGQEVKPATYGTYRLTRLSNNPLGHNHLHLNEGFVVFLSAATCAE
jgi:hypothetical protein